MDAIVGIVVIPTPGDFICGKQIERDAKSEREGERQAGEVEEAGEKTSICHCCRRLAVVTYLGRRVHI